jgi:hypothetical protein
MTIEEFDKARLYAIDKMRYHEIHSMGFVIDWYFSIVMVKI